MSFQFDSGIFSVDGLSGEVLPGVALRWYETGSSTPLATYSDPDLTVPNTNPVLASADGRFPPIWLQDRSYKLVATLPDGTIITRDPIRNPGSGVFAGLEDLGSPSVDKGASLVNFAPFQMQYTQASQEPVPFDVFEIADAGRTARHLISPAQIGAHVGQLFASWGIKFRPEGSGANGPNNADAGIVVSVIKPTSSVGEIDGGYMYVKQNGLGSDVCGWLVQVDRKGGTGFSAQWEGTTRDVNPAGGAVLKEIRCQLGVIDSVTGDSIGCYVNAQAGVARYGMLMRSSPGLFENYITCIFGSNPLPVFNVDGQGRLDIRKGGLQESVSNDQIVSAHFAATGSGPSVGNTLQMIHEFRHYTTPVDWHTSEYRLRFSVDGVVATDTWISFRGKSGPETSIAFGFGYSGSPAFEIKRDGGVKISGLPARDYASDAAAATAGVEVGELYHTGGAVKVRIT